MIIILPYVIALLLMALCIRFGVDAKAGLDANVSNLYATLEHREMSRLAIKRDIEIKLLIAIKAKFRPEAI